MEDRTGSNRPTNQQAKARVMAREAIEQKLELQFVGLERPIKEIVVWRHARHTICELN
ncbi:hypothetical protein SLEP1_g34188 [Rubroshorea leprosula]|uniref:Uncharacterized protein n=1 Tax=Rubroshorea leprosula TaxID=152421 RepID=A0AAV5KJ35_9ROSI|nr:hypothetical protein SLEP1_g34188 [Rubroshorea leprosula]